MAGVFPGGGRWGGRAADQGVAAAQHNLGVMYGDGRGVPRSDVEAVKWYRLAADQGFAKAQHNLGVMYEHGKGVDRDYVLAFMWFDLAAAQFRAESEYDSSDAAMDRDKVASKMTPDEIAEARRLVRAWKPIWRSGVPADDAVARAPVRH